MMPKTISYDVYAGSSWTRRLYAYQGLYEPMLLENKDESGTPVDLRPYDIRMEGVQFPGAKKLYFDFIKPANSSGATGLEVQGAEHNELLITLSEDVTAGFDAKVVLSDLRFEIDFTIRQSKTRGSDE